jgi:hypothetical protein
LKDFVQEMKFDRMGCFAYSHEEKRLFARRWRSWQCETGSR